MVISNNTTYKHIYWLLCCLVQMHMYLWSFMPWIYCLEFIVNYAFLILKSWDICSSGAKSKDFMILFLIEKCDVMCHFSSCLSVIYISIIHLKLEGFGMLVKMGDSTLKKKLEKNNKVMRNITNRATFACL